jgi:hypothetical protein
MTVAVAMEIEPNVNRRNLEGLARRRKVERDLTNKTVISLKIVKVH